MLQFLLVIQIIICVGLVAVILLQRSEGGALGMGGSTGGLMTARGAGNLLTRTTAILATLFFLVSFGLTILGNMDRRSSAIDRVGVQKIDPNALRPGATPGAAPAPVDVPVTPGAAPTVPGAAPGAPGATPTPSLDELTGAAPAAPATEPAPGAAK